MSEEREAGGQPRVGGARTRGHSAVLLRTGQQDAALLATVVPRQP